MINDVDLNVGEEDMWKCVDDTTISEVVDKGQESCVQEVVDDLATQASDDGFQLHKFKWNVKFDPICVNLQTLQNVNSVKLLGLNITSDLIGMSMRQN